MCNPVKTFEEIKSNFKLYIQTRFATQFPSFEKEREDLLDQEGLFYQKPYVELIQKYKSSGKKISELTTDDLKDFSSEQIKMFQSFIQSGFLQESIELYKHQYDMLKKSLEGKNIVITSGTGSGKTEAFLLPLFAYLVKESSFWKKPNKPDPHLNNWWKDKEWQRSCQKEKNSGLKESYRIPQRKHEQKGSCYKGFGFVSHECFGRRSAF